MMALTSDTGMENSVLTLFRSKHKIFRETEGKNQQKYSAGDCATVNTGVQVAFPCVFISSFIYIPRSGIAGLYGR